ncbi:MAG: glycoside hydrolase family protein [Hyphomonadaceae bacterium]|nr:glycoside hydrolase family protein [Hyphomonadaceae bacterium]
MSYAFTLSNRGVRLIRAYEGFFATPRTLTDGREVIGFGHCLSDGDPRKVTRDEAKKLLDADVSGFETLINDVVHTSLTQNQFDALVSLAFSIGREAFLKSDTLRALNRGEFIRAADGFDAWRLACIDGQVYVIDALVRRRTAEKALFLRPTDHVVRAPRHWIQAQRDSSAVSRYPAKLFESVTKPVEDVGLAGEGTTDTETTAHVVEVTPLTTLIQAQNVQVDTQGSSNRNEAYGVSEGTDALVSEDDIEQVEIDSTKLPERDASDEAGRNDGINDTVNNRDSSPIAAAAAEISERLDALMSDSNVADFKPREPEDIVTDPDISAESREIRPIVDQEDDRVSHETRSRWVSALIVTAGLIVGIPGLVLWLLGSASVFGDHGPFIALVAIFVGALLTVSGGYYLIKSLLGRRHQNNVQPS